MTALNKQALRERYSPQQVPKCHICGAEMTVQRMSASRITYGCTGATYDDTGSHYAEGRSIADDHYAQSRITVVYVSDPEVLALLDELEAAEKQTSALFKENARLKSGIAGLVHLGIRHGDIEVMSIAGDAQLSTPCTDSIIEKIAAGIGVKGE